jgi:hypothetical protein
MTISQLARFYKFFEQENSYVCINAHNIHIELDKKTGNFLNGNICDCTYTKPLFKKLYKLAKEKFNRE